jgi:hypothetical protein
LDAGRQLPGVAPEVTPLDKEITGAAELSGEWEEQWNTALSWMAGMSDRVEATRLALRGNQEALARVLPKRWSVLDTALFDREGFYAWQQFIPDPTPTGFETSPHEVARRELEDAQSRGLQVLATVPLSGHFAQRFERNGLLVSTDTYLSPEQFREAVAAF